VVTDFGDDDADLLSGGNAAGLMVNPSVAMGASVIVHTRPGKFHFIYLAQVNQDRTSGRALTEGPGCPSGYDAGLTNQTSLVRFPSPLNFF